MLAPTVTLCFRITIRLHQARKSMNNATYLFGQPSQHYHSGESFWTSFFALCLLTESRAALPLEMPAFQCVINGNHGHFQPDGELIVSRALQRRELVVEGKIRAGFLPRVTTVPNELLDLRPDIIVALDDSITVIEVKTIGHELASYQKKCYETLSKFLKDHGYTINLYYLMSAGGKDRDFDLLRYVPSAPCQFKILLWEKVFQCLSARIPRSALLESLGDITKYYQDEEQYMRW